MSESNERGINQTTGRPGRSLRIYRAFASSEQEDLGHNWEGGEPNYRETSDHNIPVCPSRYHLAAAQGATEWIGATP